jgi:Ca2+-transporting ATPase
MIIGGAWSTLVNLGLFIWAMGSGRGAAEAMTMTFVSLVLIQFVKAYNFRSDRITVLRRPFANRWLNVAILWELALLATVVYVPVLQVPFGTFSLTTADLAIIAALALTISPVLGSRSGWCGADGSVRREDVPSPVPPRGPPEPGAPR